MSDEKVSETPEHKSAGSLTGGATPQDKGYGRSESRGYRPVMQSEEPAAGPPGPSGVSPAPEPAQTASGEGERAADDNS